MEILTTIHSSQGHGDVWTVADIKNCYNKILLLIAMQSLLCPVRYVIYFLHAGFPYLLIQHHNEHSHNTMELFNKYNNCNKSDQSSLIPIIYVAGAGHTAVLLMVLQEH